MKDLTHVIGVLYGNLKVLEEVESHIAGHRVFLTECLCGTQQRVTWNNLSRGISTRCKQCAIKSRGDAQRVVGVKENKAYYFAWKSMIDRCTNPENSAYSFYGGRGISVDPEWVDYPNGFLKFKADMGERPEGYTLDRIDVNKGYSKDNCRWATMSVQNHNKRKRGNSTTSKFIGVSLAKNGWRVQLHHDGGKVDNMYCSEEDAAVAYDNFSEIYYGDRPNSTEFREVNTKPIKRGGISNVGSNTPWKVRLTDKNGKRLVIGRFSTKEEAELALKEAVYLHYGE